MYLIQHHKHNQKSQQKKGGFVFDDESEEDEIKPSKDQLASTHHPHVLPKKNKSFIR